MGWSGGSELARQIWREVRKYVPPCDRESVAKYIIELFESQDCDTIDEAELLCRDAGRQTELDGERP